MKSVLLPADDPAQVRFDPPSWSRRCRCRAGACRLRAAGCRGRRGRTGITPAVFARIRESPAQTRSADPGRDEDLEGRPSAGVNQCVKIVAADRWPLPPWPEPVVLHARQNHHTRERPAARFAASGPCRATQRRSASSRRTRDPRQPAAWMCSDNPRVILRDVSGVDDQQEVRGGRGDRPAGSSTNVTLRRQQNPSIVPAPTWSFERIVGRDALNGGQGVLAGDLLDPRPCG